jgi:hypothetical protein
MSGGAPLNDTLFTGQVKLWEEKWTHSQSDFPDGPTGDPLMVAHRMLTKYSPLCREAYSPVVNLATGKPVTSSGGTEDGYVPELAVDGRIDLSSRWSASPSPQWLQVDLGGIFRVDHIQVIPFWNGKRYYQYFVETSRDGAAWQTVVDMRANRLPAGILGHDHRFPAVQARYIRITMTFNSENPAVHLVEFRVFNAK